MVTTRNCIREWLNEARKKGASHLIVVCDTFDYEDSPVYVLPQEDVSEEFKKYDGKNMQKVMEVYSLRRDIEEQLSEHRAFHFD